MNYTAKDHTFAICAYGESRYLENCIESVFAQKIKTNVIIATSTPNDYIKGLAEKYNIQIFLQMFLMSNDLNKYIIHKGQNKF